MDWLPWIISLSLFKVFGDRLQFALFKKIILLQNSDFVSFIRNGILLPTENLSNRKFYLPYNYSNIRFDIPRKQQSKTKMPHLSIMVLNIEDMPQRNLAIKFPSQK